jgi:hypothetical protein
LQFILAYFTSVGLVDLFNTPATVQTTKLVGKLTQKYKYTKYFGYW